MDFYCKATTRYTPPGSAQVYGLQCHFTRGHDGDHCSPRTDTYGAGDVFWPNEPAENGTPSDADRIRDAMTEAQDAPGRTWMTHSP